MVIGKDHPDMRDPVQVPDDVLNNEVTSVSITGNSSLMTADDAGPTNRRLFVVDYATKKQFLVDTGADLCVISRAIARGNREKSQYMLYAANRTEIPTYGAVTITSGLDLGLRRACTWRFVVVEVKKPIIGVDFLYHYGLLVDVRNRRLLDQTTSISVPGWTTMQASSIPSIKTVHGGSMFHEVLQKFPEITWPEGSPSPVEGGEEGVRYYDTARHCLTVGEQLVFSLAHGSEEGRGRMETLWRLQGSQRTNAGRQVLDAAHQGFRCARITRFSSPLKTYITTPFGLFEFPSMSFGLRKAAQTFQQFIDEVLRSLDFCYAYIDNILVASSSKKQHRQHLEELFKRLKQYVVVVNPSKYHLGKSEVKFLGYLVNGKGLRPLEDKVETIARYPQPTTAKQLRQFLGMLNFYRRFIPRAAQVQALLNNLLHDGVKGWMPVNSGPPRQPRLLKSASEVLHKPRSFFSKKLSPTEKTYGAYDRQLLAIYLAIKHFRHIVEARTFTVFIDHKPTTFAFKQKSEKCTPQFCSLDFVSQFMTNIRHIAGKGNIVAYTLSRIETMERALDYDALAQSHNIDKELQAYLRNFTGTTLCLKKVTLTGTNTSVYFDTSTDTMRPYIIRPFRLQRHPPPSASWDQRDGQTRNRTLRLVVHQKRLPIVGSELPGMSTAQDHTTRAGTYRQLHIAHREV
ncbi:uncharacterized protein LOC143431631 [Xylocopa sonorina]|uniref:uncharacterized protein LOC143431631 n=1 Tax=Xylocopa sonorina TaxID=1818115 RepID=UPI00403AEA20